MDFIFKTENYESIDDVVFYDNNLVLEDVVRKDLNIIAKELKERFTGKSIVIVEEEEDISEYECMQISNGLKVENTSMKITVYENESVKFEFSEDNSWKNNILDTDIKVTDEQIKK